MNRSSGLHILLLSGILLLSCIGVGLYLLLILGIITLPASEAPVSLMEGLTAFDAGAGTILSVALAYLYFQQKKILEDQRDLQRYELQGELRVEDVGFEGEYLTIKLTNFSRSEISNIQLCTEIFPDNANGASFTMGNKNMEQTDFADPGYNRTNVLGAQQRRVEFRAKPSVIEHPEDGNAMKHDLCFLVHRLREKYGTTEFECRMWVEGTDQIGEVTNDRVFRSDPLIFLDRVSEDPDLKDIFEGRVIADIPDENSEFEPSD